MSLEPRWVLTYARNLKPGDLIKAPIVSLKTERVVWVREVPNTPHVEITFSAVPDDHLKWFFQRRDPVQFNCLAFFEVQIMTDESA